MEKLLKIICDICELSNVTLDTKLLELDLDSITFIRLVVNVESELKIEFDDDALSIDKYETLKDLNDYIVSLKCKIL
jgi:acyl carrier protein